MVGYPIAKSLACLPFCAVLLGGCSRGSGWNQGEIPEMHRDLSRTVDTQAAVVQGNLERARRAAT